LLHFKSVVVLTHSMSQRRLAAAKESGVMPPHSKAAAAAVGYNQSRVYGELYLA
jgi:hypothetical protein